MNFRSSENWQKKKADHQNTQRGLLHDSTKHCCVICVIVRATKSSAPPYTTGP